jgi:hypothetical protein
MTTLEINSTKEKDCEYIEKEVDMGFYKNFCEKDEKEEYKAFVEGSCQRISHCSCNCNRCSIMA